MTPNQITQLRQVLKKALELVAGERITFDAFPPKDKLEKILEEAYRTCEIELEQALALLPCSTCNGTGKSLEYAKACPECGCTEYVNENLLGENYRECKKCGQDWWLQVKYAIGNSPCPDCQS